MSSGTQPSQDRARPRGQDLLVGRVAAGLAQRRRLNVAARCLLQRAGRLLSLGLHRPHHVRRAVRRHLRTHGKRVAYMHGRRHGRRTADARQTHGGPQPPLGTLAWPGPRAWANQALSLTHSRCQSRRHPQHALGRAHPLGLWRQRRARAALTIRPGAAKARLLLRGKAARVVGRMRGAAPATAVRRSLVRRFVLSGGMSIGCVVRAGIHTGGNVYSAAKVLARHFSVLSG